MHIKNIRIAGFRSYRDQNFDNKLSPKHNVVVGKNGSGKSNFFAAIQFVLSERFQNLSADERKSLFYEGAGGRSYTMFVEITFDNSDGRLVIPGRAPEPEVSVRRTMGLKQDEFRVNERKFTALEVRQLLESAGFSSSNPYYIVEQGKIVTLAHLREDERYALLKEIAGTKVYENRRAESIALLEETKVKRSQIDATVSQLEARLAQLEAETSELKQFQTADSQRRVIECAIFTHEIEAARKALIDLEHQRDQHSGKNESERSKRTAAENKLQGLQTEAIRLQHEIVSVDKQRQTIEREIEELQARAAKLKLATDDRKEVTDRAKKEADSLHREEAELKKALAKQTADLLAKQTTLAAQSKEAVKVSDALQKAEIELAALQAKSGRKSKFATKEEYMSWLDQEIARNERLLKEKDAQRAKTLNAIDEMEKSIKAEKATLDGLRQKAAESSNTASSDAAEKEKLLQQRDKLGTDRRKLWATLNDKEAALRRANDHFDAAKRVYEKAVRHDIRQGLQSLQECIKEFPQYERKVRGQIIELMEAEPDAIMAIDVSAGNALFNVVVDSFEVSQALLKYMNDKKKPGRVTFFPLDTCTTKPQGLPEDRKDMTPLLSKVKYNAEYKSVFAELFGKTMLIRNLEDGPEVVKELRCNAVTYDGDQFSRKGGVTGGFIDIRSKYHAFTDYTKAQALITTARGDVEAIKKQIAELEQKIASVLSALDQIGSRAETNRFSDASADLRASEERLTRLGQSLEQAKNSLDSIERSKPLIVSVVQSLTLEKKQGKLTNTLTSDEEAAMKRLQSEVTTLRTESSNKQAFALQLQTECQMIEDTKNHLERRAHAVSDRLKVVETNAAPAAEVYESKLIDSDLKEAVNRLKAVEDSSERCLADKRKADDEIQKLQQLLADLETHGNTQKDAIDRLHNQRALLQKQKEEADAKIRKLGAITVPESIKSQGVAKLMQLLKAANDELKKYSHVNKKALDQYTQLHDSFKDMHEKRESLNAELTSVQRMIVDLDKQKVEAIERTFKQVQYHFEEVFKELVPADGCYGKLQLVGHEDDGESYNAVRINVSFGAGTANAELSQLSGGQKSLVALALIFAIQRSDPAPFYLFDEIDAALDQEYRASVANLIKKQSEACQFVTATFKTEMLDVADTIFGISFRDKVSKIDTVSLDFATKLLREAAIDERKRDRDVSLEMPRRSNPAQ